MSSTKTTKRALVSSVLAVLLCLAMLIGTTFAWFTDSASTAVNKIQAGKLDVALEMKDNSGNWVTAEGQTLSWVKAAGAAENEAVLWEPGCTYRLPELRIVNNGNLALKYKMVISGIIGDAKLLEAIDFTYGTGIDINAEVYLTPHTATEGIVIKGHMREDAGNEYQGLSIDGISITVIATQYTYENDSFDNRYDEAAPVPVGSTAMGNLSVTKDSNNIITVSGSGQTISDSAMKVTYPAGVVLSSDPASVSGEAGSQKTTVTQKLEYKGNTLSQAASENSVTLSDGQTAAHYELTLPVSVTNTTILVPVEIAYSRGLSNVKIYHNGTELATTAGSGEYFTYDKNNGTLILYLYHASPIDIISEQSAAKIGDTYYDTLAEAVAAAQDDSPVVLLKNVTLDKALKITKAVTIDGGDHIISYSGTGYAFTTELKTTANVTVKNCVFEKPANTWANTVVGGITYQNCTFNGGCVYITPSESNPTITIEGCTFNGAMLTIDFMNTAKTLPDKTVENIAGTLNAVLKNNTFNVTAPFNVNNMHDGVGLVMFIREDTGFYTNENSKVNITVEGNTFNNKTGKDSYCAYQIIQTWTGSLDAESVIPAVDSINSKNTFGIGAVYSWANYSPWTGWSKSVNEQEFTFSNAEEELAFCADCYNNPGTDHAAHNKYLNIVNGVAEVKRTGAWMHFTNLDWAGKTYVLEYDIDLSDLEQGAFVAFDSGETKSWQDLHLGFKKDANGITAYNTLFTNSLNDAKKLGSVSNNVHAVYTYSVNAAGDLEMKLVISDGENTYTVARTVNGFDTSAGVCWDVYTIDGESGIYAKLDNFVFKSIVK